MSDRRTPSGRSGGVGDAPTMFSGASLKDFADLKELYRNSAGAVFLATYTLDKKKYIIKERKNPELGRRRDMMHEVNLLMQLNSPFIVKCEGWFWGPDQTTLYVILEYCDGGDLYSLVKTCKLRKGYLDEKYVWFLMLQICYGLKNLHQNGIIHRDLKTMNVLCSRGGTRVKLADLGVSRQVSQETMMLQTFYGTPLYLSPEMVENRPYNEKTDIWSLGVILYELCTLEPPFLSTSIIGLARMIVKGSYSPLPPMYSPEMCQCVRWLLSVDYKLRPTIVELIKFVKDRVNYRSSDKKKDESVPQLKPPLSADPHDKQQSEKKASSTTKDGDTTKQQQVNATTKVQRSEPVKGGADHKPLSRSNTGAGGHNCDSGDDTATDEDEEEDLFQPEAGAIKAAVTSPNIGTQAATTATTAAAVVVHAQPPPALIKHQLQQQQKKKIPTNIATVPVIAIAVTEKSWKPPPTRPPTPAPTPAQQLQQQQLQQLTSLDNHHHHQQQLLQYAKQHININSSNSSSKEIKETKASRLEGHLAFKPAAAAVAAAAPNHHDHRFHDEESFKPPEIRVAAVGVGDRRAEDVSTPANRQLHPLSMATEEDVDNNVISNRKLSTSIREGTAVVDDANDRRGSRGSRGRGARASERGDKGQEQIVPAAAAAAGSTPPHPAYVATTATAATVNATATTAAATTVKAAAATTAVYSSNNIGSEKNKERITAASVAAAATTTATAATVKAAATTTAVYSSNNIGSEKNKERIPTIAAAASNVVTSDANKILTKNKDPGVAYAWSKDPQPSQARTKDPPPTTKDKPKVVSAQTNNPRHVPSQAAVPAAAVEAPPRPPPRPPPLLATQPLTSSSPPPPLKHSSSSKDPQVDAALRRELLMLRRLQDTQTFLSAAPDNSSAFAKAREEVRKRMKMCQRKIAMLEQQGGVPVVTDIDIGIDTNKDIAAAAAADGKKGGGVAVVVNPSSSSANNVNAPVAAAVAATAATPGTMKRIASAAAGIGRQQQGGAAVVAGAAAGAVAGGASSPFLMRKARSAFLTNVPAAATAAGAGGFACDTEDHNYNNHSHPNRRSHHRSSSSLTNIHRHQSSNRDDEWLDNSNDLGLDVPVFNLSYDPPPRRKSSIPTPPTTTAGAATAAAAGVATAGVAAGVASNRVSSKGLLYHATTAAVAAATMDRRKDSKYGSNSSDKSMLAEHLAAAAAASTNPRSPELRREISRKSLFASTPAVRSGSISGGGNTGGVSVPTGDDGKQQDDQRERRRRHGGSASPSPTRSISKLQTYGNKKDDHSSNNAQSQYGSKSGSGGGGLGIINQQRQQQRPKSAFVPLPVPLSRQHSSSGGHKQHQYFIDNPCLYDATGLNIPPNGRDDDNHTDIGYRATSHRHRHHIARGGNAAADKLADVLVWKYSDDRNHRGDNKDYRNRDVGRNRHAAVGGSDTDTTASAED